MAGGFRTGSGRMRRRRRAAGRLAGWQSAPQPIGASAPRSGGGWGAPRTPRRPCQPDALQHGASQRLGRFAASDNTVWRTPRRFGGGPQTFWGGASMLRGGRKIILGPPQAAHGGSRRAGAGANRFGARPPSFPPRPEWSEAGRESLCAVAEWFGAIPEGLEPGGRPRRKSPNGWPASAEGLRPGAKSGGAAPKPARWGLRKEPFQGQGFQCAPHGPEMPCARLPPARRLGAQTFGLVSC